MATTRSEMRRLDREQNINYKRRLTLIILCTVSLLFSMLTFMNPSFMKRQIRTNSGSVVVQKQINGNFNRLADLVGGARESHANLLNLEQTLKIKDLTYDYSLGIHWFRSSNTKISSDLYQVINNNIDDSSASETQDIWSQVKKQGKSIPYLLVAAFGLTNLTFVANLTILFFFINIVVVFICIISFITIISAMNKRSATRLIIHDVCGSGMRAGVIMMILFGPLALIPVIFNVETLPLVTLGYWLEIASGVFLEAVIVGAFLFIACAIPWQLSSTK